MAVASHSSTNSHNVKTYGIPARRLQNWAHLSNDRNEYKDAITWYIKQELPAPSLNKQAPYNREQSVNYRKAKTNNLQAKPVLPHITTHNMRPNKIKRKPACTHVCVSACLHVRMSARLHVCMYACMPTCMPAYVHVCIPACMDACMLKLCMYACRNVGIHPCRHVCMCACVQAMQCNIVQCNALQCNAMQCDTGNAMQHKPTQRHCHPIQ